MSANSSSNDSCLHNQHSSNGFFLLDMDCVFSMPGSFIFITYNIANIFLLLPLCIVILYHGFQQWCSTSSAAAMSHCDVFTYHMVTMELIRVSGCTLCCCGVYSNNFNVFMVGFFLFSFTLFGEILFHVLTCVERYLAVVHPITYLSLRKERGVRIRNICISCVWLLCFAVVGLEETEKVFVVVDFFLMISSFTVITFCSLSVLWVLIRSGPGDHVGRRETVDQSKLRAFYTMVAILGVLMLRFTWAMVWAALSLSGRSNECVMMTCDYWLNLPSSLVLPLLFLHRMGKLVCCEKNM